MKINIVVDARGFFCPIPVIKTAEAIKNLDSGGIVEVISDDPAIEHDMPAWCKSKGHEIKSMTKEGKVYRYFVQKK
ncbi:MAG: hypothetical protein GTO51_07240 [Candidatus Latescibacteria bacterium]|nr:hypothetical protein [Candidatus Latescibacterota bacterium]NIM22288.1 hypothetical protein [Candidatus Latescibacterota bacterium]NIM65767.1 hypothetical protein [Candidatus Latescibacterota bacterium]NIO02152.1 hypothetical protein [Candidatus Latescibacterota bacterium]NIO28984.1 hypothetical protein [Candidatus Latescibacterota bacterium]